MENKKGYNELCKELDGLVKKLPLLAEYEESKTSVSNDSRFESCSEKLKEILEFLGATEISKHDWHDEFNGLRFTNKKSKYKTKGEYASIALKKPDNFLECIIGFGWDQYVDYSEEEHSVNAKVIYYYNSEENPNANDVLFWEAHKWRKAIKEFFDISNLENHQNINKLYINKL